MDCKPCFPNVRFTSEVSNYLKYLEDTADIKDKGKKQKSTFAT